MKKRRSRKVFVVALLVAGAALLWCLLHWLPVPWTPRDPWETTEAFLIVGAVIAVIGLLVWRMRPRSDKLDV